MMQQTPAIAMALLMLAVAGCTASPPPTQAGVAGTWRLESMGSKSPPVTAPAQNQLPAGSLILAPDGSFTMTGSYRRLGPSGWSGPLQMRGRWNLDGDSVRLQTPDGGGGTGRVRGDRLVMDPSGRPDGRVVYRHAPASASRD